MPKTPLARSVTLAALAGGLAAPAAHADFIADSRANLELRNFYVNSDNRQDGVEQSKAEEWAQGFLLKVESGFTEGTVGVGVDALGLLGVKLDSSPERAGSGLLPGGYNDRAPDDYSNLGMTAKLRVSKSTLRVGTLIPKLPTILPNDTRLLPQTFRGAQLTSEEIDGLTLNAGRLTENSLRSEAGYEDMIMSGVAGGRQTDKFDFGSASYRWNEDLTTAYSYGRLDGNYKQHIVNLTHVAALGDGQSFKSDLRYARSTSDGNATVDNKAFGAMFTYSLSGHSFGLAYQKMSGDTAYPFINGSDAFLVNYVMIAPTFANADERSWQARYDYNFAAMGIPGLTLMARYISGDNFGPGGDSKEWERDTDLAYVIQSGALKNLGLKWRNGTYRASGGRKIDQNRLILSYSIPLM